MAGQFNGDTNVHTIGRVVLAITTVLASCGGDGGDDNPTGPTGDLDPNVPPVSTGTWYRPPSDITWQWQLQGPVNTSYSVALYDVDLFDAVDTEIAAIRSRGARVMCYFSAGSGEDWRPDFSAIPASALGSTLDGYPDERWLDIRSAAVFNVMVLRLDLAKQRGCDAVEPDNVTAFNNNTGFPITAQHQLAFNRNLANAAHMRGLGIALKNDGDQAMSLVAYFDLVLNEQCHEYDECDAFDVFLTAGKPVLNAEYAASAADAGTRAQVICGTAQSRGLRTLILPLDLDDTFRRSCF